MKKFDSFCKKILNEEEISGTMTGMNKKYILIDLYTGASEELPKGEEKLATKGLKKKKGAVNVWRGEEYIVVELPVQTVTDWDGWSYSG